MLILLATYLVVGLGYAAAAPNTMAIQVALTDASAEMAGMNCEKKSPQKPCDTSAARCPTGCIAPSIDLPRQTIAAYPVRETGAGELAREPSHTGIDGLPQLPPPRSANIA